MANTLISDFVFPLNEEQPDSHVMRACQRIIAQVKKVADGKTTLIFEDRVAMVLYKPTSTYQPDAPYATLAIMPRGNQQLTGQGTYVWNKTPLQLALVFSAFDGDEEQAVQPYAEALGSLVQNYLDPNLIDNPNGIDFLGEVMPNPPGVAAGVWEWDLEYKRKQTLDRKVTDASGKLQPLTGDRWRYLMEFGILTWPNTPLS